MSAFDSISAPHTDAEMQEPRELSTLRLSVIAQQIMQEFGAILTPGTRRFQRNGGIAVAELGLRAQRYEAALERVVNFPFDVGHTPERDVREMKEIAEKALRRA